MGADGKDKDCNKVYLIFTLLGICLLSPWNVIINNFSYFQSLYPDSQPLKEALPFYMVAASSYPGLPLFFLMLAYGNLVSRACA